MAWRRRGSFALVALLAGCSVGEGSGVLEGRAIIADCGLEETEYSLNPSFFSGEVTDAQMNIRVQRGSDFESYADGIMVFVRDVDEVQSRRLGLPIPLEDGDGQLIEMYFYMNESCEAGFPSEYRRRPVVMRAVGGSIIFDAIWAPARDAAASNIDFEIIDAQFVDREIPDERNATLSGNVSFFYQRGSPAQRFP